MGIRNDAREIMIQIYEDYIANYREFTATVLFHITNIDPIRVDSSLKYLRDEGALNITNLLGNTFGIQNFKFKTLPPIGIRCIENKRDFKKMFGTVKGWKKR